jgi:hypothetical protein
MRKDTTVIAPLIGVRDGGSALIEEHEVWMRESFLGALEYQITTGRIFLAL